MPYIREGWESQPPQDKRHVNFTMATQTSTDEREHRYLLPATKAEIYRRAHAGESKSSLAAEFKVSVTAIRLIAHGTTSLTSREREIA